MLVVMCGKRKQLQTTDLFCFHNPSVVYPLRIYAKLEQGLYWVDIRTVTVNLLPYRMHLVVQGLEMNT